MTEVLYERYDTLQIPNGLSMEVIASALPAKRKFDYQRMYEKERYDHVAEKQ
jgi:hypothetical protein